MEYWSLQALNGVTFGMLLFLLASGLSLQYGLMRVINIAHGSYYLLAGYVALTVIRLTGNFLLGLVAASLAIMLIGVGMERLCLRRVGNSELAQVLMTFGFLLIFSDVMLWTWGGQSLTVPRPPGLEGTIGLGKLLYPVYRLALLVAGLAVAAFLWWFEERTRVGVMLRAAMDDQELARGLGINVPLLLSAVFGLGALLAGVAGVLGAPLLGLYRSADLQILLYALVVVIVGGMGSLRGALVAALLIGLMDNLGKAIAPELALFGVFLPMALVLVVRPRGLFGQVAA
jgi:branched-chain amino acid transport system permease protein